MHSSIKTYNKINNPFFSFTGKKFLKEKTSVAHYSYDVHGNVKTLIQDNAGISIAEQRYKKIEYEYDLISGKVNAVHYQNNRPDQFHHKYEYDADNRITDVYTSKDKILWDHDAKYFYYPHGPLARVEYGDNHVQGIDYAYTLQGWIKGINSETLSETSDIGQDGNSVTGNPNAHFAKDAFGYSLTYFEGDYQSIGTSDFLADKTNSDLLKARNDLFNGNISAMVTTIVPPTLNRNAISYSPLPQGTSYKYDQLNRLVEMQAWQNIDAVNNIWGSGLAYAGMYHNKFTYDANGNILTQLRNDQSGAAVNDLAYNRMKDVNGKLKQNRLYWVNDAVDKDVFADDIDDQSSGNYAYDEIGNLTQNNQKEIQEIKYTVYGKIKEVIRTAGSSKKNLKFDYDATGNRIAKHVYSSAGVWEKSEFYARDAQGNVMSIYKHENDVTTQTASFAQIEKQIYGSTRLGVEKTKVELIGAPGIDATKSVRVVGNKEFEGSNHLGNILTTFTDRKMPIDANNDGTIDEYWPHVISSTDYYPFGVEMKERSFNDTTRRYKFNGKEFDGETGTSDFGARMLDEDLGIWNTVDRRAFKQPGWSPYKAFLDNPIIYVDPDGETEYITIITQNEKTGETTIEMMSANRVMTDGVKHMRGGNATWYYENDYYDYRTVILRTVGGDGSVTEGSKSEIIYDNGVKDADYVWFGGDSPGDTKTEDWLAGYNDMTDFSGLVVYGSANSGEDSPGMLTKKTPLGSFDFAEFSEAIGLITSAFALKSENALGPDFSGPKATELADRVKEVVEYKNSQKDQFCKDCNKVFRGDKVVKDDGVPKDTITYDEHK